LSARQITILRDGVQPQTPAFPGTLVTLADVRRELRQGRIFKYLFQFQNARVVTNRILTMRRPLLMAVLARLLSRGRCHFEDEAGNRFEVNAFVLSRFFWRTVTDWRNKRTLLRSIKAEIVTLERKVACGPRRVCADLSATPIYLRTDLVFGLKAGGSVGHIAGVLNNLGHYTCQPIFLTTDPIPTVRREIATYCIPPGAVFWDFDELPRFAFNFRVTAAAQSLLKDRRPAFIYQRYSVNNYSGLQLAQRFNVPLVLEYNGSELWIHRHWGTSLPREYESLSQQIELLNLRGADLIVVVSEALKDELRARGIDETKILVNPNGVDPEVYSPAVQGSWIRGRLGLQGKTVVGFIGTFGRWHGAEVLASAFGYLLRTHAEYRTRVRLLLIGDGMMMPTVRERLTSLGVMDACLLPGVIPQEEGPGYLAACDLLCSPHVPNPDGSTFFGSPTKLFEYMAMAKGVLASRLGQIAEVLEHGRTGWLVPPGDPDALMMGLRRLIDDEALRNRLGQQARQVVVSRYTWKEHTRRIIERLQDGMRR
jgi:glycosyltransferase involved in cell wall biosynthesis